MVSQTYHGATTWRDEMRIGAAAGLVTCAVAFFQLRELSPRLRDQIMVSLRDRVLIEARARGRHAESATGYYALAAVLMGTGFSGGLVFGPWMPVRVHRGLPASVDRHCAAL